MSAQRKAPERGCATAPAVQAGRRPLIIGPSISRRAGLWTVLLLAAAALLRVPIAQAGDPQSYRVDMASTGDSTRDDTLKASSDLISLRKTAPVGPVALIGRARGDLDRLKTVL